MMMIIMIMMVINLMSHMYIIINVTGVFFDIWSYMMIFFST